MKQILHFLVETQISHAYIYIRTLFVNAWSVVGTFSGVPISHCMLISKRRKHMAKRIAKRLKMELPGGDAHPGPKLASAGVQMAKFCTDFNAKTADRKGQVVPVIITAYEDKSYDFEIKTTPARELILKAAGLEKGSGNPKQIVGHISQAQLEEIANYKMPDLNANDIEAAKKIIAGSARNMGITIDEK